MAKDSLFRNALNGYNKDDVTGYIENLNIQFNEHSCILENKIKELEKENRVIPALMEAKELCPVLSKENDELKEQVQKLSDELAEKDAKLCESLDKTACLEQELETLKNKISESDNENSDLKNKIESLNIQLEQKQQSDNRAVKEAEMLAESILAQARDEAQAVIEKAQELSDKLIENAKKQASQTAKKTAAPKTTSSEGIFSSHRSKIDALFASITESLKGESK